MQWLDATSLILRNRGGRVKGMGGERDLLEVNSFVDNMAVRKFSDFLINCLKQGKDYTNK